MLLSAAPQLSVPTALQPDGTLSSEKTARQLQNC